MSIKENEIKKFKKATVITLDGEKFDSVKVVEPIFIHNGEEVIRVYGNPNKIPGGRAFLTFEAVYDRNGIQVL